MSENIVQVSFFGSSISHFKLLTEILVTLEIPAKLNHIKSKQKILEEIENDQCQLIIGSTKKKGFDVLEVAQHIQKLHKNINVLGLYKGEPLTSIEDAMQQGMNDYINLENKAHLRLVIQRELNYLKAAAPLPIKISSGDKDFTGLYSRLQLVDYLEQLLIEKAGENHAIFYLQLDNFSWINESIGIISGDSFLKDTANIISSLLEAGEVAARYQGGSFVIIVHGNNLEKLSAKADMFRESIMEAISYINGNSISSSCSIGIRQIDKHSTDQQRLISDAFAASDMAKAGGGDAVQIFHVKEESSEKSNSKQAWKNRIKDAFEHDLFHLFYQPIVSLRGDTKPRYEVLLRMKDDEGNIISPGTFLPYAERAGLMADIDRRVILQSLEKWHSENAKGRETEIFIKLSGKSLDDKNMPNWITNTIKEMGIDASNLVFEITESLAISQLAQTRRMINSLKSMNCKIAIDHFGTRLKSYKLLERIDVDIVKVDGSLVSRLQTNKSHQLIVKRICKAAKNHNIQLSAESIQDVNSLPMVWQYGFDFVQGYFMQIPDEQMDYDFSNLLI